MLRHHGDVLLTSPVFTELRRAAPQAEADALVYRETLPMLAFNPDVATVHTIDRGDRDGAIEKVRREWRLFGALKARRYDLVIHLTDHRRGAWLVRGLAPRWSVAPKRRGRSGEPLLGRELHASLSRTGRRSRRASALGRRHTVDQNLDALRRLGLAIDRPPPLSMVAGDDGERDAAALLARLGVDRAVHRDAADVALAVQVLAGREQRRAGRRAAASRRDRRAVVRARRARARDAGGDRRCRAERCRRPDRHGSRSPTTTAR